MAGADEAGRGSLAGPLVAAAVLIDYGTLSSRDRRALGELDDSKARSPEDREALYPLVVLAAASVGVPPLAVVSVAAGAAGQRRRVFAPLCLLGRTVRFTVVVLPLVLHS